jgi:hypothetical protein
MHVLYGLTQYETPGLMVPDCEWQDIIDLCDARRMIERTRDEKWQSGWLSPAILHSGATSRQIADVERMAAWIGLDLDDGNFTLKELLGTYFGGAECVIYSTTRSTASEPRWRVLMPLSREMSVAEFAGVWKALNSLLDGEIDIKTRNVNRLHYLPATWQGGNNEYHSQHGAILNVDELLTVCPPEEPNYTDLNTKVLATDRVSAPDGIEIITGQMIDKHVINGKIGGRFFKLLCAAATRCKANGWMLTASELANAALLVSPKDSSGMNRAMGAYREAERALSYINSRVETVPAKAKLLANMKWRYSQAKA